MNTERKQVILEKLARISYGATKPISRFLTSPGVHAGLGATRGAALGAMAGGPAGALVGAPVGAAAQGGAMALTKWFAARGTIGRIKKARRLGKHPFHFLTEQEKAGIKAGGVKLPRKLKKLILGAD